MGKFILLPLALLVIAGVYLLRRLSAGDWVDSAGSTKKVVIIVKDQEPWLECLIRKLFRAVKNTPWVGVLVVDDCSRDGTPEILARLQSYYPFDFVSMEAVGSDYGARGASGAQPAGVEAAFAGARCFDLRGLRGGDLLRAPLFCQLSGFRAGNSRALSK